MMSRLVRTPITVIMLLLTFHIQFVAAFSDAGNADISASTDTPEVKEMVPFTAFMQKAGEDTRRFVPGDGIWINTFPDTSSFLNRPFPIDNNGMIEFPLIGKVRVTDMTVTQLEEYLKTQFKSYLRFPNVRVKPMIRISVLGGVPKPGLFYVDYDQSLWEVMYYVGGTVNEDGLKKMRLERDNDVVYSDLIPFLEKGVSLKNMGIKSGDQIWVPSPDRPTLWTQLREIMPLLTFSTSLLFFYLSYQQQLKAAQTR